MLPVMDVEKEMQHCFEELYEMPDSEARDSLNNHIIYSLKKELSTWDGFYYKWSALDRIGKVASEDNRLKIFTWYLKKADSYEYYGLLVFQPEKKSGDKTGIPVVVLEDHSREMKKPEYKSLRPDFWYGAVYYDLKTYAHGGDSYYTLIGFDFTDNFSNKKIIEILTIDNDDQVNFGGEIFMGEDKIKRAIFEYSSEVVMSINFDERLDMIVYDHLRPYQPLFEGNYRFYAPDGTYDGLRFDKGEFIREEDVDARNL